MVPDNVHHGVALPWLTAALEGDEPFGSWEPILASAYRIVTTPSLIHHSGGNEVVLPFLEAVRSAPAHTSIAPSLRLWQIFEEVVRSTSITGRATTDALLAALAMDQDATFYSFDRDFQRYSRLRWHIPRI